MKILAFDTTMQACSAAVMDTADESAIQAQHMALEKGHAEKLLPMIQGVMQSAGFSFQDLDQIVVTAGPGAFTGVRIGLATARGMALGQDVSILAVTSLHAIALEALTKIGPEKTGDQYDQLVVATDARRGEVYFQTFDFTGKPLSEAKALTPHSAAAALRGTKSLIVGSGGPLVLATKESCLREGDCILPHLAPNAKSMISLATNKSPVNSLGISPVYLRAPDAKPQTKKLIVRATQ